MNANETDIGSSTLTFRNLYLAGTAAITGNVTFSGTLTVTGNVTTAGNFTVATNKGITNATNSQLLILQGGLTLGASLQLAGTTDASLGAAWLITGANASAHLHLRMGHASASIKLQNASGGDMWDIASTGSITQNATNGGSIILSKASTSVAQPVVTGITAAGTTVSDATALTGVHNIVSTAAAGTGVKLWAATVGTTITVQNLGANDLEVYPPDGSSSINGAAGGAGITLAAATDVIGVFTKVTATVWTGFVSAGVAT